MENEVRARVTREEVFNEAQAHQDESLASVKGKVPQFMLDVPSFRACIIAGGWLKARLCDLGLSRDVVFKIGFAHGQRSLSGDAYEWASQYYNDALEGRYPTPGEELSREIIDNEVIESTEKMKP